MWVHVGECLCVHMYHYVNSNPKILRAGPRPALEGVGKKQKKKSRIAITKPT